MVKNVLASVVDQELILLDVDVEKKEECIAIAANKLYEKSKISSVNKFLKDVLKREELTTTGIGIGVAIPHAQSLSVVESSLVILRLKNKIDWQSFDGKGVELVFLIAIREEDKDVKHIQLLGDIATILMEDGVVEELKKASSKEEIKNIIYTNIDNKIKN